MLLACPGYIWDKTNNISDRNQQVAQEKPTPNGKSDMPALEGRKDIQSTQIVSGQLVQPDRTVPAPPQVTAPPKPPSPAAPRREQNSYSGFDKQQGGDSSGYASNLAKGSNNPTDVRQSVDGAKDGPRRQWKRVFAEIDPKHPQPRKKPGAALRPAILPRTRSAPPISA